MHTLECGDCRQSESEHDFVVFGAYIMAVYKQIDRDTIRVKTAYEVVEP
jgi:hypothetical protein